MLQSGLRGFRTTGRLQVNGVLSLLLAIAIAGCANMVLTPSERVLEGRAIATDGDSIRIDSTRIRLKGLDAPELDQTCQQGHRTYLCGEFSRDALLSLILRSPVKCRSAGRDKYKRVLAKCSVGEKDLGSQMVASGWAVGYGDYERQESHAKARRAGLWAGTFDAPREWRRRHPSHE